MESERAIKLRYIEIDPEIIAELPNWSKTELERESERTLKELSITRGANESYLLAWARAMLEENDCEDNADNHKRLIVAIREDWKAQLFVWALGGDERKAFGVEDSPAFQEYLVRHYADRALAPGAFYDHDDRRYYDYVEIKKASDEKAPEEHPAKATISNRSQVIRLVLFLILIWSAITIPLWYRSGLKGWVHTMTEIFGIYATGFLSVAVEALILGLLGLVIFFSWIIIRSLQRRNMMSDANLLKLNTALLIAVIALLLLWFVLKTTAQACWQVPTLR